MKIRKPFYKINYEDIDIASEFFDHNQKHLSEFIMATISYYTGKNVEIKTKIVEKYFKTYKKTMDAVIVAKGYGLEGAKQKHENQEDIINTLKGGVLDSLKDTLSTNNKLVIINNKEVINNDKPIIFNFKNSLIDYGFNLDLINDWLIVRKQKKASNTKTAFNNFISQVEKTNLDKNKVLEKCISRSWSGFEAKWVQDLQNNKPIEELSSR